MEFQKEKKAKKYSWLALSANYKKPEALSPSPEICICERKRGLIICDSCKNSFVGRIGERCQVHPEIAFLMDARNCAFCGAPTKDLRMVGPL